MKSRVACVTCVTLYPFSGISYEKFVQEKDPGNDPQCDTSETKFFPVRDLIHWCEPAYVIRSFSESVSL